MIQIIAVVVVVVLVLIYQICAAFSDVDVYSGGAKSVTHTTQQWYGMLDIHDRMVVSPLEYYYVRNALHKSKPLPHSHKLHKIDVVGDVLAVNSPYVVPSDAGITHIELFKLKTYRVACIRYTQGDCVYGRIVTTSRAALNDIIKLLPNYVDIPTRVKLQNSIKALCKTLVFDNKNEIIEYSRVVGFDLKKTVRLPRYIYLAPKLDGQMCFVFWNSDGYAYYIRDTYVKSLPKSNDKLLQQSLFVAECVGTTYYVVDVLLYNARYIADENFDTRLEAIPHVDNMPTNFMRQSYIKCGWENKREGILSWKEGIAAVDVVAADLNAQGVPTDGIIIQPPRVPYYTLMVQKWKPPHEQTSDALLDGTNAWLHAGGQLQKQKVVPYNLSNPLTIGECLVDITGLKPTGKLRPDKYRPNGLGSLHSSTVLSQRDVLEGRTGHLMKFYNRSSQDWTIWPYVKKHSTVFDIGAGKGRSADWWKRLKLKVYAVEPDSENYKVLVQRAKPFASAMCGGESTTIRELVPQRVCDAVIMSFSISFFFQSRDMLQQLVSNIVWSLKNNGMLIGIGLDGECVMEALRNNNNVIDCDAFTIRGVDKNVKPYGCKITIDMKHVGSLVKDQTEYLIFWDEWKRVLAENNIELVKTGFLQGHWCLAQWPLWFARSTRWWVFRSTR